MAYNDRNINRNLNIQKHRVQTFVFKNTMVVLVIFANLNIAFTVFPIWLI